MRNTLITSPPEANRGPLGALATPIKKPPRERWFFFFMPAGRARRTSESVADTQFEARTLVLGRVQQTSVGLDTGNVAVQGGALAQAVLVAESDLVAVGLKDLERGQSGAADR